MMEALILGAARQGSGLHIFGAADAPSGLVCVSPLMQTDVYIVLKGPPMQVGRKQTRPGARAMSLK